MEEIFSTEVLSVLNVIYKLPKSLIGVVQSGPLPYSQLNLTSDTLLSKNLVSIEQFLLLPWRWLIPTLIVMGVMVLMAMSIPVVGVVVVCCRRRGRCCAKAHYMLYSNHELKCAVTLIFFIASNFFLVVGVAIGLVSNFHLSSSLNSFAENINNSLSIGLDYANSTLNELNFSAVGQSETALSYNPNQSDTSRLLVTPALNAVMLTFSSFISNTTDFLNHLDMVYADFIAVNDTILALRNRATMINSTLLSLQVIITGNFTEACGGAVNCENSVPLVPQLSGLGVLGESLNTENDVNLSDVRHELSDPSQILADMNRVATDYLRRYDVTISRSVTPPVLTALDTARNFVNEVVAKEYGFLSPTDSSSMQGIAGVKEAFDLIHRYIDRYEATRYLAMNGLFLLFSLLLLLLLCGLTCGCASYKRGIDPIDRSLCSNRAAKIIQIGVVGCFMIGYFGTISAILYLPSTLLQHLCSDLGPPDYVFLSETFDNQSLWDGGRTFLSMTLQDRISATSPSDLTFKHLLTNCSKNVSIYQALRGTTLFDLSSLFTTEKAFDVDYSPLSNQILDEILTSSTRAQVSSLAGSIENRLHLSVYTSILSRRVLSSSVAQLDSGLADLIVVYNLMV